ncbi:hypothetical protein Tco_1124872 [Tanacetum coccineum]|uniref:Uncharacterized protein n=1 Tax=Tanacetum coccineum TaxID=301880 RepID=A0ABQ5J7C7_9ASTR
MSARVESSKKEASLGEDASKQGRIDATHAATNMFGVNELYGEEVFKEQEVAAKKVAATDEVDITMAQTLLEIKSTKLKEKVVVQELGESTTISSQKSQDTGKGIMIEKYMIEHVKPMKRKEQIRLDEELAFKLQAEEEEERLAREKAEQIEEANIAWDDIQAKIEADYQLAERLQAEEQEKFSDAEKDTLFVQLLEKRRKHFAAKRAEEKRNKPPKKAQQRKTMCTYLKNMKGYKPKALKNLEFEKIQEIFDKAFKRVNTFVDYKEELVKDEEEVTIDVIPLAVKSPTIVDWKIDKERNKSYYQIIRANGSSQMYRLFNQLLKSFNKEDLEVMYKLVKARFTSTKLVEDLDLLLWGDLKIMFEPHVEDTVWRNQQGYKVLHWKLYDSYGMIETKLKVDYEFEMAYQLLKLIRK